MGSDEERIGNRAAPKDYGVDMQLESTGLAYVDDAIDVFGELEGQDDQLALEMVQAMIRDLFLTGQLKPIIDYVKRYCDVTTEPEDVQRIAEEIENR